MIKFSLRCSNDHVFDSWFSSNETYEDLDNAGMLSCPICGSDTVGKNMMAPQLRKPDAPAEKQKPFDLSAPEAPAVTALAELRRLVEKKFENVGRRFAAEARAMNNGEAPERSIVGEAKISEAAELLQEGIPLVPLPWPDTRKSN
ncbi:MAG: DUF1178 family protein [Rhodobacteraceae bacterium]|nr:DUF1178 family protein [Paracoccaceae bacterium]